MNTSLLASKKEATLVSVRQEVGEKVEEPVELVKWYMQQQAFNERSRRTGLDLRIGRDDGRNLEGTGTSKKSRKRVHAGTRSCRNYPHRVDCVKV